MIKIDRVEIAEPLRSAQYASFDSPGVNSIDGLAFRVSGWFRRPRGTAKPQVRFHLAACEGAEPLHWDLREIRPHARPDVPCEPWEVALGFEGYIDAILLPQTFRVLVSYRRESGEDCLIGEIAGRRTVLAGQYQPRFQPIVVYHGGRMGSTAMMAALLSHPEIAIDDKHPFENNIAGYFGGISNTLLRTATMDAAEHDWNDIRQLWHRYGPSPTLSPDFQSYASIEAALAALAELVSDFARASIDRAYGRIAERTKKPAANLLAEKETRPDVVNALLWLYPRVKLILLTRDPRDVLRSARDFNAKRAALGFGREYVENDEDWIDLQSGLLCSFVDVFDNHPPDDRLDVRFEDFIADTRGTLERVCAFLEVDRSGAAIDAMNRAVRQKTAESEFHRTTRRGKEVGSWRDSLPPAHARRIVERTRPFMRRFGYEVGPNPGAKKASGRSKPKKPDASAQDSSVPNPLLPVFTSYSANFEDVILRRLFPNRATGFYVDVGAAHPTDENDTKTFYDAGWHGINVEPNEKFFTVLNAERPRDRNLQVALSNRRGTLTYYEVIGTGLSTCDKSLAGRARRNGHQIVERVIAVSTLAHILDHGEAPPIDFLKIDVEGFEQQVLAGNNWSRHRPSVIVVEATVPESAQRRPTKIRAYLGKRDYIWKYFDGLNDFYVAKEFRCPRGVFDTPPNVFDRFRLRAIAELEQRVTSLSLEAQAARREAAETAKQRDDIERASEEAVRASRAHERRANELGNALNELERHAKALSQARDEAVKFVESEHASATDIWAQLAEAQRYVTGLQSALDQATEQVASERQAREHLEANVSNEIASRQAAQAEAQSYIVSLKASLADRDAAISDAQAYVQSLEATVADRDAALQTAQTYVDSLRATLGGHGPAMQEAQAYVQSLEATVADRDAALQTAQTYVDSLRATIGGQGAALQEARAYAQSLEVTVADRDAAMQEARAYVQSLEATVADRDAALQTMQTYVDSLKATIEGHGAAGREAERYVQSLLVTLTEREASLQAAQTYLNSLTAVITDRDAALGQAETYVLSLKDALARAEAAAGEGSRGET